MATGLYHEDQTVCLALSIDGRLLASGSIDTTILLYDIDLTTNFIRPLSKFDGHNKSLSNLAIHPLRHHIASCDHNIMLIWDTTTHNIVWRGPAVCKPNYNPAGTQLCFMNGNELVVLDATSVNYSIVLHVSISATTLCGLQFSFDGSKFLGVSAVDQALTVWDAVDGSVLQVLSVPPKEIDVSENNMFMLLSPLVDTNISCCCFHPLNSQSVFSGSPAAIREWDLSSGKIIWEETEPKMNVLCKAISSNGRLMAVGSLHYGAVVVWSLVGNRTSLFSLEQGKYANCSSSVYSVFFSKDSSRLVVASNEEVIRVWDAVSIDTSII